MTAAVMVFVAALTLAGIAAREDVAYWNGRDVLEVVFNEGRWDVARCEQLNAVTGVASAGAVLDGRNIMIGTEPASRYSIERVTPGYLHVVFPDLEFHGEPGLVAGPLVAERFGLVRGGDIAVREATGLPRVLPVSAVAHPSARADGQARRLFEVMPATGVAAGCLVSPEHGATAQVQALLTDWWPAPARAITFPVEDTGSGRTPQQELGSSWAHLGWLATVPVLAIFLVLAWSRRSEIALYRLHRLTRAQALLMHAVTVLFVVLLPWQAGTAVGLAAFILADGGTLLTPVLIPVLAQSLIMLALGPPLAWLLTARTLAAIRGA
ncbi:hypothetical protein [Pseudactinotalea sp. HY158]|uniref:hypothetical protein n=1 Tax=Pseudactinotalea sp. HY158 TaxID=2654547 RepID=UPI00129D1C0D|nr:hypothetical protein [Pseudactinotalea sp. HY158]QGH68452.1 hypothetical protein GCE65_02215 [Pseudactinotalea sp. HY158]